MISADVCSLVLDFIRLHVKIEHWGCSLFCVNIEPYGSVKLLILCIHIDPSRNGGLKTGTIYKSRAMLSSASARKKIS